LYQLSNNTITSLRHFDLFPIALVAQLNNCNTKANIMGWVGKSNCKSQLKMSTSLPVKCHLPLITTRIEFRFNVLPPPPQITPRRDLGAVIRRQARRATPYGRSNRGDTPIRAESPLTDIPDSDTDSRSDDESRRSSHKISKPKGEAGKSNSGGYNLQDAMGWENEEFSTFTVSQAFHVPKKIKITFATEIHQ
jgi:hypothetical protein